MALRGAPIARFSMPKRIGVLLTLALFSVPLLWPLLLVGIGPTPDACAMGLWHFEREVPFQ